MLARILVCFFLIGVCGLHAESEIQFSNPPSDAEIFRYQCFSEPLVPSGETVSEENEALASSLKAYKKSNSSDDVSPIVKFLAENLNSKWRISLLTNLGRVYFETGRFSKASKAWEEAWSLGKNESNSKIQSTVDLAIAQLAKLNARIGRMDQISGIFDEVNDRKFSGSADLLLRQVKDDYGMMRNDPSYSFWCGPSAILKVRKALGLRDTEKSEVFSFKSTYQGTSLDQLKNLMDKTGMKFQMAFRPAGSDIIFPAIIHWKLGHFAAITQKMGNRYLVEDATFGENFLMTKDALDSEASGYALIAKQPLPSAWRSVDNVEGKSVWGKGRSTFFDPQRTLCSDEKRGGGDCAPGMPAYSMHLMLVSLSLVDTPVTYTPPVGPEMNFTVRYNQKDDDRPTNFSFSNLGARWTFGWVAYVTKDAGGSEAQIYSRGGGWEHYFGVGSISSQLGPYTNSTLSRIGTKYVRTFRDGSTEIYDHPDSGVGVSRKVFLTAIVDPAGNAVTIQYDTDPGFPNRIVSVKDALMQETTLSYEFPSDGYRITKVTQPAGRVAKFEYTADKLTKITDAVGMASTFSYQGDFIYQMITPYGTTKFNYTESNSGDLQRTLVVTDPKNAQEKIEFRHDSNGVTGILEADDENIVPDEIANSGTIDYYNTNLIYRNSFYWSKKAMAMDGSNYLNAEITHWKHGQNTILNYDTVSGVIESRKKPLENRVYFIYDDGGPLVGGAGDIAEPITIMRLVRTSPKTTQSFWFTHDNATGVLTSFTDPVGRTTMFDYYPNRLDLQTVRQTSHGINDVLMSFGPYTAHQPSTITDAAGKTVQFSYNGQGQMLTEKVFRNSQYETTTWSYIGGYLQNITGPISGSITSFIYDSGGRVKTISDSEGYSITKHYDALNRPTTTYFPDGTYTQIEYDRLDPRRIRDRAGRWTRNEYDELRRLVKVTDPMNHSVQYVWCDCGNLEAIIDAKKNRTSFDYDLQSRVVFKRYDDNSGITFNYNNLTGSLQSIDDANYHNTAYQYNLDDSISTVTYSGGSIESVTPNVKFEYDNNYPRVTYVKAAIGGPPFTTQYSYTYNPIGALGANNVNTVSGALTGEVISYTYDELGRVLGSFVNGVGSSVTYDALGRVSTSANPLGVFNYFYVNQSGRVDHIDRPGGSKISYGYSDNLHDQQLAEISNIGLSFLIISKFNYFSNPVGNIVNWTQQIGSANAQQFDFGYDTANRLRSADFKNVSTSAIVQQYSYRYDSADNRISEQINSSLANFSNNDLNQLTSTSGGGSLTLQGSVSEPAKVTVGGVNVPVDINGKFQTTVNATPGANAIAISAIDGSNNVTNKTASVNVPAITSRNLSYDSNGNLTNDGEKTYEWDGANRLITIFYTGTQNRTEFSYDALGRRIQISEKTNAVTNSTKKFVWIGDNVAEERDASNNVTRRFFDEGEQISGLPYLYNQDHLGSIWELTDLAGYVHASYSYDPYGRRQQLSGGSDTGSGNPLPVSGAQTHRSEIAGGEHQHYFYNASATLPIGTGDKLVGWVYLDPVNPPKEVMFQWYENGSWEHRAYWGQDFLNYGAHASMGALPTVGGWVRLEVPASAVGLEGKTLNGMAFSLYDGRAWWDAAGKRTSGATSDTIWVDDTLPAGAVTAAGNDTWTWTTGGVQASFAFTGHYFHAPSKLSLTLFRAYDANKGRWLSRDPIGESEGTNLYSYVLNNPANLWDPLGLCESSPLLSWVPGQQSWDYAQTNFANGNYGTAAANFASMIAEQSMFVASFGASGAAGTGYSTVSRWGKTGALEAGDWVMNGPVSRSTFTRSFKWDPNPTNMRVPFKDWNKGSSYCVPSNNVKWPSGWEKWKGIFGQRQYFE